MNELIKKRCEENLGSSVVVYILNGRFRFVGKLINVDDDFFEMLDYKISGYRIINFNEISNIEFPNTAGDVE